ncbi:uncharacterized protein LOC132470804 [Gadus macrocephalus]|uniref:uncharacterized protein LOC132470804 n=1 Tax=Gadus macrocephalus TaxID=80720 RepID=UPI0028CB68EB|nr:uncharacterized protein LOC132470804 [Gadus macrocephalus]
MGSEIKHIPVTMATSGEQKEYNGQLISVNRRDTRRLLEVYVKRSLSLNDGAGNGPPEPPPAADKWVPKPQRPRRVRRHSSDPSLHLSPSPDAHRQDVGLVPPSPSNPSTPEPLEKEEVKPMASVSKKTKKPSMWKSFLGLFSKKWTEDEPDGPPPQQARGSMEIFQSRNGEQAEVTATCLPLSTGGSMRKKSRRKRSTRLSSFKRSKSFKKSNHIDITVSVGEAIVNVEPTYAYFEKVSEEMDLIVRQVTQVNEKVMTNEEVINRIIALTKEEGDAIDEKLKENPTLSNFFKGMSYPAFKKLADNYLEEETTPVQSQAPSLPRPVAAPELVKLAFTLDFTARLAGLSRQNVGYITGLGNRYLADRFEYTQACTDHPWSDTDD